MFLQTNQNNKRDIIIHFWTLRASTHERPPCVLRHMGNAYAVFHIFTHTLPPTIEMASKRSTLNGQRFIRHNDVFTSCTNRLTGHPRVNVSQGTRSWPIAWQILHLVTLPYEMAVLTITRWEVRAPYQAAYSDRLIWMEPYHLLVCSSYGTRARMKHVGYSKDHQKCLPCLP